MTILSLAINRSIGGSGGADWQLADGHYYDNEAIVPLKIIHPLSDGGTGKETVNSWARHRWAHSEFKYIIPFGVQGGAFPYHYELVGTAGTDYPLGMTIGEDHADVDYGTINWTPSTEIQSDSWTMVLKVTDQTGRSYQTTWTLTLDDTMFKFQDSTIPSTGGTGAWADPYKQMSEWYGETTTDAGAAAGKIMVYRAGTHPQDPTTITPVSIAYKDGSNKPNGHIGVPGESVIWDMDYADSQIVISNVVTTGGYNWFFSDITLSGNIGARVDTARNFFISGSACQCTFTNVSIINNAKGITDGNNGCPLYYDSLGTGGASRDYVYIHKVTTNEIVQDFFIMYTCKYVLLENCTDNLSTLNSGSGLKWAFFKGSSWYTTARQCTMRNGTSVERGIIDHYESAIDVAILSSNHEVCYNNILMTFSVDDRAIFWRDGSNTILASNMFRNTVDNATIGISLNASVDDEVYVLRNAVYTRLPLDPDFRIPPGETNVYIEEPTATPFDAEGKLTDAYLTANSMVRGTHGHEIM